MSRMMVIAGAVALTLCGCATAPDNEFAKSGPYESLEAAVSSGFQKAITEVPSGERPMVASCYARSIVSGITPADQGKMLNALNSQKFGTDDLALFDSYFPTDRQGNPNPTAAARAVKNAKLICPDTLARYPAMFS